MKKALAILCALALLSQLLAVIPAGAADQTVEIAKVTITTVTAEPGATGVEVPITLTNNQGICGMKISVAYDAALTLTKVVRGDAIPTIDFTNPATPYMNPVNLAWDGMVNDTTEKGTLVTLTFNVAENAPAECEITASYVEGDVYDENLDNVDLDIVNGKIVTNGNDLTSALSDSYTDESCSEESDNNIIENHNEVEIIQDSDDKIFPEEADEMLTHFLDIDERTPDYESILNVVKAGLFVGVSENQFAPDAYMTRAMIVTVLHRMEGTPIVEYSSAFQDVSSGEWYMEGIEWAASCGIVLGYGNGLFGTQDNVTREQLVTILYRYAIYKGYDIHIDYVQMLDEDMASEYATEPVCWAAAIEMLRITEGRVRPTEQATRAELARAVDIFLQDVKKP